jgi:hypothetical protein
MADKNLIRIAQSCPKISDAECVEVLEKLVEFLQSVILKISEISETDIENFVYVCIAVLALARK